MIVGLAPFCDCTVRLGGDPAGMFDEVASLLDSRLGFIVSSFGRRRDITLRAFYWLVAQWRGDLFYVQSTKQSHLGSTPRSRTCYVSRDS